ncbi:hypothetical protein GE09DRAFT_1056729 [Coniochaeta sp. 2T2.1]|nr:hypothetical protein GE09DRAFT_1056729 [Coniochaeta sp. 2T2.1]
MSLQNLSIHLAARPDPANPVIVPGKTFTQRTTPAPSPSSLGPNQLLLQTLYISLDPAMRGWIEPKPSYLPPVPLGAVMRSATISRVLSSTSPSFSSGDLVTTFGPGWTEYQVLPADACHPVVLPPGGRVTDVLGALGLNGWTAYFGLKEIAKVKRGETVVISGAAGATGSVAGQIAKNVYGARVVGIAGGEEKCRWLREELGFDVALDYKGREFEREFEEATGSGVDVFWDNVGGEILDLALGRANKHGRFVECGMISQVNLKEPVALKNLFNIVYQRINFQGFIVLDFAARYPEAGQQLAAWLAEGKIKSRDTIVKGGLKVAEEALLKLFEGHNIGKMMVEVKNPDEEWKV